MAATFIAQQLNAPQAQQSLSSQQVKKPGIYRLQDIQAASVVWMMKAY
jgi:hypothetical protein